MTGATNSLGGPLTSEGKCDPDLQTNRTRPSLQAALRAAGLVLCGQQSEFIPCPCYRPWAVRTSGRPVTPAINGFYGTGSSPDVQRTYFPVFLFGSE
ncbi:hypothetical protein ACOMHN_018592 [Nucella lapillus]